MGLYMDPCIYCSIYRVHGPYQLAEVHWSGCGPHLVSQYSQFIGDPLPASLKASVASEAATWCRRDPGSDRRLWPGCSGRAVVCHTMRTHKYT